METEMDSLQFYQKIVQQYSKTLRLSQFVYARNIGISQLFLDSLH